MGFLPSETRTLLMVREFDNNFTQADPNSLDYSIGNGGSIYGAQRSPGCLLGDVAT